jgi:hypothetical protein
MWYSPMGGAGTHSGWVAYTKAGSVSGHAANVGATRGVEVSWLQQPGFIVAPSATEEEMAAGNASLLRIDEQAALHDVLGWCAASDKCEGFTFAQPPSGSFPVDRLQTACYCCRVDVRTSRAQLSWTKWSMPLRRRARMGAPGQDAVGVRERATAAQPTIRSVSHGEVPPTLHLALRRLSESGALGDEAGASADGRTSMRKGPESRGDELQEADMLPRTADDAAGLDSDVDFEAQVGFIVGAEELHSAFMTLEQARSWCTHQARCFGFAVRLPTPSDAASGVLYVALFGRGSEVVHHPEWLAWTRRSQYVPLKTKSNEREGGARIGKEEL